ncbi:hypothetical protein FSP39_017744 [Pinctada imbricata]|uniref:beta-N-acetylhexosaminidase n=1 Tax=Pinctada imbricata TaxID=66713 RepID=A0AA88YE76_PINIB|nr:hypothetical protein FSP39_017744 [Pinctada imbricata]
MKWIKSGVVLTGIFIICHVVTSVAQFNIDYVKNNLKIRFTTLSNFVTRGQSQHELELTNVGNQDIPVFGWACYFCHDQLLFPEAYNGPASRYQLGSVSKDGLNFEFLKGCMYRISPSLRFHILRKTSRKILLPSEQFSVSKYDSFPNFYCTAYDLLGKEGTKQVVIDNTRTLDYVKDFNSSYNWFRFPHDFRSVPLQPQDRFFNKANHKAYSNEECLYKVIPTPDKISINESATLNLKGAKLTVYISAPPSVPPAKLNGIAKSISTDITVQRIQPGQRVASGVHLIVTGQPPSNSDIPSPDEAYSIDVKGNLISVEASAPAGLMYGVQTLKSFMAWESRVPLGGVKDFPRFPFRGIFLDIASNFPGYDYLKKFLKVMAQYKLNKLVLPIYNNQGFRLQLNDAPTYQYKNLHEVGSRRCHDLDETKCMFSSIGSDPNSNILNGYLTKAQMIELLEDADLLNIEIIPSLNIGESARAAIVPLKRGSQMSGTQSVSPLYDPDDIDFVDPFYPQKDSAMNPCRKETKDFYIHVLRQLKDIYGTAALPLKTIMIGSKVNFNQVLNSKYCYPPNLNIAQRLSAREQLRALINQFKLNFTTDLVNTAKANGISNVMAIDDFLTAERDIGGNTPFTVYDTLDPNTRVPRFPGVTLSAVHSTYSIAGDLPLWKRGDSFAELGYKVILSPPILDFNYAIEPDPDLPGDYDAVFRNISLSKLFRFTPDSRCCNIPNTLQHDCVRQDDCPTLGPAQNFIGTLGKVDSRKLRTLKEWNNIIFPRLVIFAERSWHKSGWESSYKPHVVTVNNVTRTETMQYSEPQWAQINAEERDIMGCISRKEKLSIIQTTGMHVNPISSYVEPPGARVIPGHPNNKVEVSNPEDGFKVQYKIGAAGSGWQDVVGDIAVPKGISDVWLRTITQIPFFWTEPTPRARLRVISSNAMRRQIGAQIIRAESSMNPGNIYNVSTYLPPVPLQSFDPADDRRPDLAAIAAAHPPTVIRRVPAPVVRPPFLPFRGMGLQPGVPGVPRLPGQTSAVGQQTGQQALPGQQTGQNAATGLTGQQVGQQPAAAAGQATQQGLPGRAGVVPGAMPGTMPGAMPGMVPGGWPSWQGFNPMMARGASQGAGLAGQAAARPVTAG